MMKKIAIIGSGGSGKSTLSQRLGKEFELPVYHLDTLYWKPGWCKPESEEWADIQKKLCQQASWIVDGNYVSTLDIRLDTCDTVIFLDVNRFTCIYRVIKRTFIGRGRVDLAEGCEERFDMAFIKYLWDYPKQTRVRVIEKINATSNETNLIIAKSGHQALQLYRQQLNSG